MISLVKKSSKLPDDIPSELVVSFLDEYFDGLDKFWYRHEIDYRYVDRRDFEDQLGRALTQDEWDLVKGDIRNVLEGADDAIDGRINTILETHGIMNEDAPPLTTGWNLGSISWTYHSPLTAGAGSAFVQSSSSTTSTSSYFSLWTEAYDDSGEGHEDNDD